MKARLEQEHADHFVMNDGSAPFRVPKHGLSEKLQNEIRGMAPKMAEGGSVPLLGPQRGSPPVIYDQFGNPVPDFGAPPVDAGINFSAPPPVSDAGMPMAPAAPPPPAFDINARAAELEAMPSMHSKAAGDADEAKRAASFASAHAPAKEAAALGIRPKGAAPAVAPQATAPAAPVAPAPAVPRGSGPMPGMADVRGGIEVQKGAAVQAANVAAEQGRAEGEARGAYELQLEANALEQKGLRERAAARGAEMMAKRAQLEDEMRNIDTTVDPGRFWASRSTAGKIAGIIGLALGALGAGADGVNRAAGMLTAAIDRDLEAQKAEHTIRMQKGRAVLDANQAGYAMHRQIFEDDLAAMAAAKATAIGIAENKLKQIAAGAQGPAAQAQAIALAGALQVKKGELEATAANTAFDNNVQRMLAGAQLAKPAPGGQADKAALTEIEGRNQSINQSGKKLLDLIDAYGTSETITPGIEGQMGQLANDMAVDAAKLKDPTSVARPGEVELELQNLFKPGAWQRDASAKAKIQAFMNNAEARRATAYSVRGFQAPPTPQVKK